MKWSRQRTVFLMAMAFGVVLSGGAESVSLRQDISIVKGWNALYLAVTPEESADEIFGAWPVEMVGVYNPSSFLATKQFSGSGSNEGVTFSSFNMWRRDKDLPSPVTALQANYIYVFYATNSLSTAVFGVPNAPRNTWHPTSGTGLYNLIGLSVAPEKTTTAATYFSGLDVGQATYSQYYYQIIGGDIATIGTRTVKSNKALVHGNVLAMNAGKTSDWSGVLFVSPAEGVDFSTNMVPQMITVRNDGAVKRTIQLQLLSGSETPQSPPPPLPSPLLLRDLSVYTNDWVSLGTAMPFTRVFAPGEEVSLLLAVDRTQAPLSTAPAGTYFGGLLAFTDVDGGSNMRVVVPVSATSVGAEVSARVWPMGLWIAEGCLTNVTTYASGAGEKKGTSVAAGGKMSVRLPLYVNEKGQMTLLSRFVYGTDEAGGVHIYSGLKEQEFPVPIGNIKRVTSAVLPIDEPVIEAMSGTFGGTASFAWTVGEGSRVNPMRHAFHPSHDGKRWDFTTPSPSGDNPDNYVSTIKPEMFSISNGLALTWDQTKGRAWSPEEKLTGQLVWELTGVRKEGPIKMSGSFTMQRIANLVLDK